MPRSYPIRPITKPAYLPPRGFIRPGFDFHYDSAGFQGADGVPLADGDVQGDYRAHNHIISAAGLSRPELISVLLPARKQWPSAKILGISELGLEIRDQRIVSSGRICPSDAMNQIRRTLSELP